ncbi:MAG: sigma-70 family RNA polymerase sigma factor [Acidobacteria bacterium]|nr:sigma-70 family RNA polymerase sigma factor [Acidobacteriota bacterium]
MFSRDITAGPSLGLTSRSAPAARPDVERVFRDACDTLLPPVHLYVRYRVGRGAADDLAAQVFLKALDRLDSFDSAKGDMQTWVFGIARNVVRDHLRAGRRWRWLPVEWLSHRASTGPDPERTAIDGEQHRHLAEALATLSDRERDVLGLKFGGSLTNRAIASLMGLSESHVAVVVYRALGKLRQRLEQRQGVRHA